MADAGAAGDIAKELSDPWGSFASWVVGLIPSGPLNHLALVVLGLSAVLAVAIYKYHLGLIDQGTAPEGSIERKDYERLRASLEGDNIATRTYKRWLEIALDKVDRFFGDAGMADRSLFPHAFGLRKAWPLWTAPAFDRCLLLALIYPVFTIVIIWGITGHIGVAEAALHLPIERNFWHRSPVLLGFGLMIFSVLWLRRNMHQRKLIWFLILVPTFSLTLSIALATSDTLAVPVSFAVFGAAAFAFSGAATLFGASVFLIAFACMNSIVIPLSAAIHLAFTLPIIIVVAFTFIVSSCISIMIASVFIVVFERVRSLAEERRSQGLFLSLYLLALLSACFTITVSLSRRKIWIVFAGPNLLYLGLLTLLNAPFDWISLGLTRALLRRGLELGGLWPLLLALIDAALAAAIIFCLSLVMVLGVQSFGDLAAVHGGEAAKVLPLRNLFNGIEANPAAPEYWWVYALLLSTMIPSLLNLMIGGMALTRGIPWLARALLAWMPPAGQGVPKYKQNLMALGLTIQWFAGAILGIAAQAIIVWLLLYHILPFVGLDLLTIARELEKLDLPGALIALALPHPG